MSAVVPALASSRYTVTLTLILLHQPETTATFGSIHRLCYSNYDLSTPTLTRSSDFGNHDPWSMLYCIKHHINDVTVLISRLPRYFSYLSAPQGLIKVQSLVELENSMNIPWSWPWINISKDSSTVTPVRQSRLQMLYHDSHGHATVTLTITVTVTVNLLDNWN